MARSISNRWSAEKPSPLATGATPTGLRRLDLLRRQLVGRVDTLAGTTEPLRLGTPGLAGLVGAGGQQGRQRRQQGNAQRQAERDQHEEPEPLQPGHVWV